MPHGLLFTGYLAYAIFLKEDQNWSLKVLLLILFASIVPFGTFYIDKAYLRP